MSKQYQLIDCETKGNVVRLYYGDIDNNEYWGDDWDDPIDNSGIVYSEYIKAYKDISFPFDSVVLTPVHDNDFCYRHPYITKEDLKKRRFPCLLVKDLKRDEYSWEYDRFLEMCAASDDGTIHKFYFGDLEQEENLVCL